MNSDQLITTAQAGQQQPFETLVIGHTRLVETLARVMNVIRNPCGTSIVLLFGPTRVGKTTLLQKLLRENDKRFADLIEQDRSVIPSYYVEVPVPENGKVNWRDLNIRALEKLNEPHLDKKGSGGEANFIGINGADVRRDLEKTIKNRRTTLGVYDEAQHLTMVVGAKTSQQQQDYIKSLANLSGIVIILAGTFAVLELLPRNAQLAARMLPIHLARYHADDPDDWRTFRQVVLTFQQALPVPQHPALLDEAEFLYQGSFGEVGLLKCWLDRTLALVKESGSQRMTLAHLKATRLPKPALVRIEQEIREGEAKAADYDEAGDAFRDIMKSDLSAAQTDADPEETKRKNWPVGQRKPHRDKVGIENA